MKMALTRNSLLSLGALFAAGFLIPYATAQTTSLPLFLAENIRDPSTPRQVAALNARSGALVEKVKTGKVEAVNFRIDVALYRESLRELMLANEHTAAADRISQTDLMEMVRMAALLQAASNCETGRYLVCPADLMERLIRQQSAVIALLKRQT